MKLTHFSLCSGIGGLDLAAEWAGFETIGQCEIDEYASRVLAKNFRGVKNYGDIRTITAERLERNGIKRGTVTVLSAGIPCQPYSLAGKGLGDSDERDLEQELIRVIGAMQPRWVVVENTPGLFARKNQRYFNRILADISALGYSIGWGMWGACDVGAPHRRERVFIICRAISDASCGRCGKNEIQRGEPLEGSRQADKRRIHYGRMQSKRVCNVLPYTASDKLGLFRREKKITRFRKRRDDNRNGAQGYAGWEWWQVEPDVGRVANGISNRVDRLRCLGNAVVPQQAYPIFKAIADYEIMEAI